MAADLSFPETIEKLALALGLGLLIGMQRERTDSRLAGFRTFPLATMFGTLAGLLAMRFGGWIIAAGLACRAALLIFDNFGRPKAHQDIGVTTEVAV